MHIYDISRLNKSLVQCERDDWTPWGEGIQLLLLVLMLSVSNCEPIVIGAFQLGVIFVDVHVECAFVLVAVLANGTVKRNVWVDVLFPDVSSHAALRIHKFVAGEAQEAVRGLHYLCRHHACHSL